MKKKGLTLVELLIVVGIIAVLAGLLFSVFSSVRENACITYCINSFKQVGIALYMYAQDHDEFVPPYCNNLVSDEIDDDIFPSSNDFFPNFNDPALFEAAFAPYTKDKQIWYCPLDPFAGMNTLSAPMPGTWAGFMWNNLNHKATSYEIDCDCALREIAPINIAITTSFPKKILVRKSNKLIEHVLSPYYAIDYTHVVYPRHFTRILLRFDGSIKIIRHQ